jgi:stearoyl-CoA desaturase (Delta-9 desaturase)
MQAGGAVESMSTQGQLNWRTIGFIIASPIASLVGLWFYISRQGVHAGDVICLVTMTVLTGLAITAGYHRYYSHRTYECHPAIQAFYVLFGAAALQAPVLRWVHDHRDHHRFVDHDEDPYNISKGFFWAHVGWTFYKDEGREFLKRIPDLASNRLLLLQDRYFTLAGLVVGLGCPFLLGLLFGRPWGGVLWGGLVRVVLAHHCTFLINSAGHYFGHQRYSNRNSSRDSPLLALLTLGEGYHNFHHTFPRDYRNGIRWYHWDPTKWWIASLAAVGLAWRLHTTPRHRVDRARMSQRAVLAGVEHSR